MISVLVVELWEGERETGEGEREMEEGGRGRRGGGRPSREYFFNAYAIL